MDAGSGGSGQPEFENDDEDEEDEKGHKPSCLLLCCVRVVHHPLCKGLILCVVCVVPGFGLTVVLPSILRTLDCASTSRLTLFACAIWVSVQFVFNFMMSQWLDPGGPEGIAPQSEASGQFVMALPGNQAVRYAPNFCRHCHLWKPPRTHHCRICHRCVLRMDHHCPFVGNCIGMRNHGHFVLMYVFALVGVLYSYALCIASVLHAKRNAESPWNPRFRPGLSGFLIEMMSVAFFYGGLEVGLQLLFTTIAFVALVIFGMPALYQAATGTTIIEQAFPMKEYVEMDDRVYCPLGPGFYRRSLQENVRDLLGRHWILRLALPVRGVVPLGPAVSPTPSPEGVLALQCRLREINEGCTREVASAEQLGIDRGPMWPGQRDPPARRRSPAPEVL